MNTPIIITLMICSTALILAAAGTVVALAAIGAIQNIFDK